MAGRKGLKIPYAIGGTMRCIWRKCGFSALCTAHAFFFCDSKPPGNIYKLLTER